jgi:hypothetical protein
MVGAICDAHRPFVVRESFKVIAQKIHVKTKHFAHLAFGLLVERASRGSKHTRTASVVNDKNVKT